MSARIIGTICFSSTNIDRSTAVASPVHALAIGYKRLKAHVTAVRILRIRFTTNRTAFYVANTSKLD